MSSPSQQQQQQSISSTLSLTSLLHQKLTTNNDLQKVNQKQVLLNDIASGLANAVAVAVSNAVSNINNNSQQHQEVLRQQLQQPAHLHQQLHLDPQKNQQFSHLRQQLESKEPTTYHHLNNQNILRKRLSNINIEAAVASAVNRYLATTIKNNQEKMANSDDVDMIQV